MEIEERVKHYWTVRSHDFGAIRKNELEGDMGRRWLEELEQWLPKGKTLDILDVGTGTGFFAILLAGMGHRVTGIDLTPAMLEEGRAQAAQAGLSIDFRQMDAQEPDFPEGSFDVVLSRNLTWTLPDPEKAYSQWLRVLRRGGLLLNFDADYAANVRSESTQNCSVPPDSPYGHVGMTRELVEENKTASHRDAVLFWEKRKGIEPIQCKCPVGTCRSAAECRTLLTICPQGQIGHRFPYPQRPPAWRS